MSKRTLPHQKLKKMKWGQKCMGTDKMTRADNPPKVVDEVISCRVVTQSIMVTLGGTKNTKVSGPWVETHGYIL